MSSSSRKRAAAFLVFLFILITLLVFTSAGRRRVPIGALSDGTPVFLEAVTDGTRHSLGSLSMLRQLASDFIPFQWARWTVRSWSHPDTSTLGVWISQPATSAVRSHLRLSFVDPDGLISIVSHPSAEGERGAMRVRGFDISQFPRRETTLRLQLDEIPGLDLAKALPRRVGEISFPNPAQPLTHNWVPEPLPITRKRNGAIFILHSTEAWNEGGHWVTRLEIENTGVRRNLGLVELSDPAGNRLPQYAENRGVNNYMMNEQWVRTTLTVSARGALSAREPAWKVRFPVIEPSGQSSGDFIEFLVPPKHVDPPPGSPVFRLSAIDQWAR